MTAPMPCWLGALFREVWMPPEVRAEVIGGKGFAGEQAIEDALAAGWLRISEPVQAHCAEKGT